MRPSRLFLIVALVFLAGCSPDEGPQFASNDPAPDARNRNEPMSLHQNDLRWLVENSTLVFTGRLRGKDVERDERGLVITRNHFGIEQILLGSLDEDNLTLTTLGGTLGQQSMQVSHMPVFEETYQYVIFTDPNRTTYDPVTGNQEGVFLVSSDSLGIYNYDGIGLVAVDEGILRFGEQIFPDKFGQDPRGPVPVDENPKAEGDVLTLERTDHTTESVLSLDQFIEIVRSLTAQR